MAHLHCADGSSTLPRSTKDDLPLNTIIKVKNGINKNPTIETLTKIAKALEIGVDDLIK